MDNKQKLVLLLRLLRALLDVLELELRSQIEREKDDENYIAKNTENDTYGY